jgi:hypothetical protein
MGWVLSVIINPVVVICYLVIFIFKKKSNKEIPVWLMGMNILFLVLQFVFLLFMSIDKF